MKFSTSLKKNVEAVKNEFAQSDFFLTRDFLISGTTKATVLFVAALTDVNKVLNSIIKPCTLSKAQNTTSKITTKSLLDSVINGAETKEISTSEEACEALLLGDTILLVEKQSKAIAVRCDNLQNRAIAEPPTSPVLKGPREGFVESLKINKNLLLQRLNSPDIVFEHMKVGKYSQTDVAVVYFDDIADKTLVKKIVDKIKKIDIDGIIDSSYISSFIEEHPESIFKQIGNAEKPDTVCSKILEGRIAIMVDGSPIVLTLPFALVEDMQTSDDYYNRSFKVSFARILRVLGFIAAIILPGFYVAIQLYHYRIIPIKFLVTIVNSTQGLPMTPFFEILFIIFLFEILYEASLHMPKYLGMSLSVIGALVLGDTAVKAGLVSSPSVMIVALSGIMIYTLPDQVNQASILRLVFVLMGGIFGLFGIMCSIFIVTTYLISFENFGVPYLMPLSPFSKNDSKDFLQKKDLTEMKTRPEMLNPKNKERQ